MNAIDFDLKEIKGLVQKLVPDKNISDDVLQQSLLKALTSPSAPKDNTKIIPWFAAVIKNTARDIYRGQKRTLNVIEKLPHDEVEFPDDFDDSVCKCVLDLTKTMSTSDQTLLRLLEVEGESGKSVANTLGITVGALKVRRHRARKSLESKLRACCGIKSTDGLDGCEC
ncbi:hypothetical protein HOH87_00305 [bacterium]|jgi:RNA polymerase sigma-70 factor, ECF subfamily|nr:hypothetical protein [bacterium]